MKKLDTYIYEKLILGKNIIHKSQNSTYQGNIEIINHTNCRALSKIYMNAIIEAFLSSPLKKDVVKIEVMDAKTFFTENEIGSSEYKHNQTNLEYLYNSNYPAIILTFHSPKIPKYDTLMKRMPSIYMPLILSDDKGLFTQYNSWNRTGLRDVENAYINRVPIERNSKMIIYKMAMVYVIKPNATKKLLPVEEFKDNLKKFYKLSPAKQKDYLSDLEKDFYTDDRRNKYGALELDKEREDECEKHMSETWKDN